MIFPSLNNGSSLKVFDGIVEDMACLSRSLFMTCIQFRGSSNAPRWCICNRAESGIFSKSYMHTTCHFVIAVGAQY